MRVRGFLFWVKAAVSLPSAGLAHVSDQGFVLLLPTGAYSAAGVAVVALTVLALLMIPARAVFDLFEPRRLPSWDFSSVAVFTSLASFLLMCALIWLGLTGSRDPLSNLMPLSVWTIGWVAVVSLSVVLGDVWRWLNPWSGLMRLLGLEAGMMRLPDWVGLWGAIASLIGLACFLLADLAPDDPARLARLVAGYWVLSMIGVVIFGRDWLERAELGHVLIGLSAHLAPLRVTRGAGFGLPGWQVVAAKLPAGAGVFALVFLGVGSFDGVNETFWWLAQIGVNPLEFPGRSAVVVPTLVGLALAIVALLVVFAVTLWLGRALAGGDVSFWRLFDRMGVSVLPIALGYHVAHYLTSFLINVQYWIAALSDPFARGDDFLGIAPFRVTTGFLNSIDTVRVIWMTQASAVVLGHVLSVLIAHRLALELFDSPRKAGRATLPLSVFMVAYTFLGLWLLAAPKGA